MTKQISKLTKQYLARLYDKVTGFISFSAAEKNKNMESRIYLTYGEILFDSVTGLMNKLNLDEKDVFYDLGSGVGKMALQVFMTTPIKEVYGIEASIKRFEKSCKAAAQVEEDFKGLYKNSRKLQFINANIVDCDMKDATIIFACATCFGAELLTTIAERSVECTNLKYLISLKKIPCNIPLKTTFHIDCSWDKVKCYIYSSL